MRALVELCEPCFVDGRAAQSPIRKAAPAHSATAGRSCLRKTDWRIKTVKRILFAYLGSSGYSPAGLGRGPEAGVLTQS